ncbi:MAG: hypothetical protein JO175_02675 [Candidatus Eremiobacteraeota bacterium]|nr:hypothetical protein [Candidatus Eremiobacteraeota bacterium]
MKPDRRHACRGAALAETAAVLAFTLVSLFGMLQIVLIGYLQVAGDAAVFFAAHWYTLGVTQANISANISNLVPPMITNALTYSPAPPPSVDPSPFNVMYGSNMQAGGQNSRNGGFTLVRPQNYSVSLNQNAGNGATAQWNMSGIYGYANVPISSGSVEGYYLMTQNQMDQLGGGPNSFEGSNVLNPTYASPFLPQNDAVIANMNTPPYYVPATFTKVCADTWSGGGNGGTGNFGGGAFGQQCNNDVNWYYGVASYLSNYNYAAPNGMGVNNGQVFGVMAAHQRIFAYLIPAFPFVTNSQAGDVILFNVATAIQGNAAAQASTVPGFINGGTCGGVPQSLPMYYYDEMAWWEKSGNIAAKAYGGHLPFGINRFGGNTSVAVGAPSYAYPSDAGNDGPEGPNCGSPNGNNGSWNGASFALVYWWDQPGIPNGLGAGFAPTNPLAGATTAGDPAY